MASRGLTPTQSFLQDEFKRFADMCPGRSHVYAQTFFDWDVDKLGFDSYEERFPLIDQFEWLRLVGGRRDDVLNTAIADGGNMLRRIIGHHVIDVAPPGYDRTIVAEGAFQFAQLSYRDPYVGVNSDIERFWQLAELAEVAFEIAPNNVWRSINNHPFRGNSWLCGLYRSGFGSSLKLNMPVLNDPAIDRDEMSRFFDECGRSYELAINHPKFGPLVSENCRRWYVYGYLLTDVFRASVLFIERWQQEQSTPDADVSQNGLLGVDPPIPVDELPANYRDGGTIEGHPLTTDYIDKTPEWDLRPPYISKLFNKRVVLTKRKHLVGRQKYAYDFAELCALRRNKTDKDLDPAVVEQRIAEARAEKQRCRT